MVEPTLWKNISQNWNLPQGSGWKFLKKMKPPPRLGFDHQLSQKTKLQWETRYGWHSQAKRHLVSPPRNSTKFRRFGAQCTSKTSPQMGTHGPRLGDITQPEAAGQVIDTLGKHGVFIGKETSKQLTYFWEWWWSWHVLFGKKTHIFGSDDSWPCSCHDLFV